MEKASEGAVDTRRCGRQRKGKEVLRVTPTPTLRGRMLAYSELASWRGGRFL